MKYHEIKGIVDPKKQAVEEMNDRLAVSRATLADKRKDTKVKDIARVIEKL